MRTLEEIEAAFWDDKRSMDGDESIPFIREAHALGRSEGYAEGVEAAREAAQTAIRVWATGTGTRVHEVVDGALRALRAPSPAAGTAGDPDAPPCWNEASARGQECGRCTGEFCDVHGRDPCSCDVVDRHSADRAPSPKEDAPECNCNACASRREVRGTYEDAPRCEACGHPEDAHNSAIANGCCHGEWERCGCFRFVGGTGRSTTGGWR